MYEYQMGGGGGGIAFPMQNSNLILCAIKKKLILCASEHSEHDVHVFSLLSIHGIGVYVLS